MANRFGISAAVSVFMQTVLLAPLLVAQNETSTRERLELTRTEIRAKRQTILTQAIDLTEEEGKAFWPLYRQWQADTSGLDNRFVDIVAKLTDDYANLTDKEAKQLIDEWLDIQAREQKLEVRYAKRLRKILPEKKALRVIQLKRKLDAIVAYSLSGTVPLAEQ